MTLEQMSRRNVMNDYLSESNIFKALSEPIRLQIIDLLSSGELCACDILKNLSVSQSTLSHHMKALIDSELLTAQKRATWMYYSINYENVAKLHRCIDDLTRPKEAGSSQIARSACARCSDITRKRG